MAAGSFRNEHGRGPRKGIAPIVVWIMKIRSTIAVAAYLLGMAGTANAVEPVLRFSEVSEEAGVRVPHAHLEVGVDPIKEIAGGVAAGDVDGDGWVDFYVVGGEANRQYLFLNAGDGTFREQAVLSQVDLPGQHVWGPALADVDGDGDLDLFVGGFDRRGPVLFLNDGEGFFTEVARSAGMFPPAVYVSASFSDYDLDGDLDLFTTHWFQLLERRPIGHVWRNDGTGNFVEIPAAESGVHVRTQQTEIGPVYWSFTANLADMDGDGLPDLLLASDYGFSQYFRNMGGGRFEDQSTAVLSDENGMGAAVGDYDNDGDLDWFVTSIFDPSGVPSPAWGASGNRLYRNTGGVLDDATDEAGVRDGSWGWGACFADFDNDGDLDLFHVNGYREVTERQRWLGHPARLFLNQGDGSFVESAAGTGIDDRGNGRGVACFDYDRDGDIDVFISNVVGTSSLYRNELDPANGFLGVRLVGRSPNSEAVGSTIAVAVGDSQQLRHINSGNHYGSQSPAVAHFGLGQASRVDAIRVTWPGGRVTQRSDVRANREIVVFEEEGDANCDGSSSAADFAVVPAGQRNSGPCPRADVNLDDAVDERDWRMIVDWIFAARGGER